MEQDPIKKRAITQLLTYFESYEDLLEHVIQLQLNKTSEEARLVTNWFTIVEYANHKTPKKITCLHKTGMAAHEYHALHYYAAEFEDRIYDRQETD